MVSTSNCVNKTESEEYLVGMGYDKKVVDLVHQYRQLHLKSFKLGSLQNWHARLARGLDDTEGCFE